MSFKIISENRKAYYNYEILETYEAGMVLSGAEIKAIRAGKINLTGSYAKIIETSIKKRVSSINKLKTKIPDTKYQIPASSSKPELFLLGANIAVKEGDTQRTRKLLMHHQEINRLIGKTQQKNLTLVPLKIYLKNGKAKIELGLARGKRLYDKREIIKKRDLDRESRNIM